MPIVEAVLQELVNAEEEHEVISTAGSTIIEENEPIGICQYWPFFFSFVCQWLDSLIHIIQTLLRSEVSDLYCQRCWFILFLFIFWYFLKKMKEGFNMWWNNWGWETIDVELGHVLEFVCYELLGHRILQKLLRRNVQEAPKCALWQSHTCPFYSCPSSSKVHFVHSFLERKNLGRKESLFQLTDSRLKMMSSNLVYYT